MPDKADAKIITASPPEPLESDFLYSVLLWNNHLPIRYRHRQSGSTAYRLQARPALTGL